MADRRRFLILGASGFLGRYLYSRLGPDRALATYRSAPFEGGVLFDAATMRLRDTLLSDGHDIAAAFLLYGETKIDTCARDPAGTWRVNVEAMTQAIDDLVSAGVKPVYASSDAVFGSGRGNWTEDDPPNPTLTYGKQKAAVERYLAGQPSPWVVARLSKIVASDPGTQNLLGDWVHQIEAGATIHCATDLIFTPAHVDDVVTALLRLAEGAWSGLFNVSGPRAMSRMDLLQTLIGELRRHRDVKPKVVACSIRDFPFLEPRPCGGSLVPEKLYRALGFSFRDMQSVCSELARTRYGEPGRSNRASGESSRSIFMSGEKQYQEFIQLIRQRGNERLGLMTSWAYLDDPKRLAFTFSRYKFVAKMLSGSEHVLEVGCGDAFATRIVAQEVKAVTAVDFDENFVRDALDRMQDPWRFECRQHDVLQGPVTGVFDGIFSLDVLEHIPAEQEQRFVSNMIAPLSEHGITIIGMPSLQSQTYASAQSRAGHVNCKDQVEFKDFMRAYFHNVFMFSMNDEVVHTGYHAMSHYNLALCCGRKG